MFEMRLSLLRVGAVCSILALVVLSWLPGQTMVRSGLLSPSDEHFLAYMGSALLVTAALPRYRLIHIAWLYVVLAGVLELGQNIVPGRDPEVFAAFVSMCGAIVGWVAARLLSSSWRERLGLSTIPR